MKTSGIKPEAFRLVTQCRNQIRYRVPPPPTIINTTQLILFKKVTLLVGIV